MALETPSLPCSACGRRLPIECFKLPRTVCADCLVAFETRNRQQVMDEKAKALMTRLLDDNFIPSAGLTQMADILGEVYNCFGGPKCFAQQMYDQMQKVMARVPAQTGAVLLLLKFLKLHMNVEENLRLQETADMTDDQLRREQELGLMKLMLDAATDPKRRQLLDQLMGLHGIKLVGMTPAEILHGDETRITTDAQAGSGA